jgi:membrane-associated protease RseP (regulator of RpoE activity)
MNASPDFVPALLTLIVFLMVVSVVHDLGQMLVARWCGVPTRWRFAYVELPEDFRAKPLVARASILAAGLIANLALAIVLLAVTYLQSGAYVTAARVDELVAGGLRPRQASGSATSSSASTSGRSSPLPKCKASLAPAPIASSSLQSIAAVSSHG